MKCSTQLTTAFCLALGVLTTPHGWSQAGAPVRIGEVTHFDLEAPEGESLTSALQGRLVYTTHPVEVPDPDGNEIFHSSITLTVHAPHAVFPFVEIHSVVLGPGEVSDVAAHPAGRFFVANIRSDDVNQVDRLVLFQGRHLEDRVDLPDSADGLGLSPSGRFLVVAVEKGEAIHVYDIPPRRPRLQLRAVVGREVMEPFFVGEEERLAEEDIEPESVTFSPDSQHAFVSLQEQASIAVIDLGSVAEGDTSAEQAGAAALANVIHLPFGFRNTEGSIVGVEPDGLGVSPDGSLLVVANEASGEALHLQGLSVIDLRQGVADVPEPLTFCVFDVDHTLLEGTGLEECPGAGPAGELPPEHDLLPRIDPNNTELIALGDRLICGLNIERAPELEDRGSVLFLDMTNVLATGWPGVIGRVPVGLNEGARPEGMVTVDNRFFIVALQRDGGTIARIEILEGG